MFWIATAWLAAGLFIGPLVSGHGAEGPTLGRQCSVRCAAGCRGRFAGRPVDEHPEQALGRNFVLLGPQGYEYVDLGRVGRFCCSSDCCSGCSSWCASVRPALAKPGEHEARCSAVPAVSAGAIGLFYGAGLTWGQHTHLAIVEYWRWWVVHLWVEGFFEVFATTVIAFFFTRLNLIRPGAGGQGGAAVGHHLPVRRHHRHVPSPVLLGHADRGAGLGLGVQRLEVVPLVLVGYGAWTTCAAASSPHGRSATAGRSTSSSPWPSGTWSARGCSAS